MSGSGHGSAWFGEDAIYFDHSGDCHDARYNKGCPGRWRGAVSLGYGPEGKRIRRKVSGRTKQEVRDKLRLRRGQFVIQARAPASSAAVKALISPGIR